MVQPERIGEIKEMLAVGAPRLADVTDAILESVGAARVSLRGWSLIARISGRKVTIDKTGPAKGRDAFAPSVPLEEGLRAMGRWMEATKA